MSDNNNSISEIVKDHERRLSDIFNTLWTFLLGDKHGISKDSYIQLIKLASLIDPDSIRAMNNSVCYSNNRYLLPENSKVFS